MFDSKIISILRSLETRERTRFREYVHSPFFNKHEGLKKLCDFILESAPHFEDAALDKKAAFALVFPKESYSEQKIYTLVSNLLELMNGYLAQLQFEEKSAKQKLYTLAELRKRRELKQWQTVKKQYLLLREKSQLQDSAGLREHYIFYEEADAFFLSQNLRQYDENLQLKADSFDNFYISEKLKTACDMQSRNIVIKANYESWGLDFLIKTLEETWARFADYPAITVYMGILKMLRSGKEEDYFEVKRLLEKHLGQFSKEETKLQYDYAINYVIRQLNSSRPDWYREFLDLHRFLLEHEILLVNGELPEWDYKNIVTVALRIDALDWVERFIHDYQNRVPLAVRENVFNYNLAAYYFASKQYKKALQLLLQIEFTDESYQLGAKIIQLKSYYELEEWEAGLSLITAFRQLVERSRSLSEYRKLSNLNMLKVAKKLLLLTQDWDFLSPAQQKKGIMALENALKKYQPLANLDWVEGKLEDLKLS